MIVFLNQNHLGHYNKKIIEEHDLQLIYEYNFNIKL